MSTERPALTTRYDGRSPADAEHECVSVAGNQLGRRRSLVPSGVTRQERKSACQMILKGRNRVLSGDSRLTSKLVEISDAVRPFQSAREKVSVVDVRLFGLPVRGKSRERAGPGVGKCQL